MNKQQHQDDLNELERLSLEVNDLKAKLKEAGRTIDGMGDAAEYNTNMRLNAEATTARLQTKINKACRKLERLIDGLEENFAEDVVDADLVVLDIQEALRELE